MPLHQVEENLAALETAEIEVSAKGIITSINEYGAMMFGYYVEELVGQPLSLLIPIKDQVRQETAFLAALAEENYVPFTHVAVAVHKTDGFITIMHRVGRRTKPNGEKYFIGRVVKFVPKDIRF